MVAIVGMYSLYRVVWDMKLKPFLHRAERGKKGRAERENRRERVELDGKQKKIRIRTRTREKKKKEKKEIKREIRGRVEIIQARPGEREL